MGISCSRQEPERKNIAKLNGKYVSPGAGSTKLMEKRADGHGEDDEEDRDKGQEGVGEGAGEEERSSGCSSI